MIISICEAEAVRGADGDSWPRNVASPGYLHPLFASPFQAFAHTRLSSSKLAGRFALMHSWLVTAFAVATAGNAVAG